MPKLMDDLVGGTGETSAANRLGRNEHLLTGLRIGAMTVVDLTEAFLCGQTEAGDMFEVTPPTVLEIRWNQFFLFAQVTPDLVGEMENRGDVRAGLLNNTLIGKFFARTQHTSRDQRGGHERLRQFTPNLFRPAF